MSTEHTIHHVTDLLKLSTEEMVRLIPDLLAWHTFSLKVASPLVKVEGFIWVDDTLAGKISAVHIKSITGEKIIDLKFT